MELRKEEDVWVVETHLDFEEMMEALLNGMNAEEREYLAEEMRVGLSIKEEDLFIVVGLDGYEYHDNQRVLFLDLLKNDAFMSEEPAEILHEEDLELHLENVNVYLSTLYKAVGLCQRRLHILRKRKAALIVNLEKGE